MSQKDYILLGPKRKRQYKKSRDLLLNVTEENKKSVLNSIYSVLPVSMDEPDVQQKIRSIYPRGDMDLSLFRLNMMRLHRRKAGLKIAIACMPKSGSTFILGGLARVQSLKLQVQYIHTPYINPSFVDAECRENELDELALLQAEMQSASHVAQLHMKSSGYSENMLGRLGYKTIIVQRNIFDCLVSMDDMLCAQEVPGFAMFRPPSNFREMDRHKRLDLITRMAGPWYLEFAVSWARTRINPLFLHYDQDVRGFSEETARKLTTYLGASESGAGEICKAFELKDESRKQFARLNSGTSGRGAEIPQEARQFLLDLASYYERDVDFQEMGLL